MNCRERFFPETRFGGFTNFDGTVSFFLHVNALLKPTDTVLDVGCGRGAYQEDKVVLRRNLRILRGKVQKVIGLDPDPNAAGNPFIDEFCQLKDLAAAWPIPDNSVDLIVTDWTLEHMADPDLFFGEARRVLRTGGYLCVRTTNAWGYVAVAARLIPQGWQERVIQRTQERRPAVDIFPTRYACNSVPALRKKLRQYGFKGAVYGFAGLPGYLDFSCILYYLGVLYERYAPHFLRQSLIVFARKDLDPVS